MVVWGTRTCGASEAWRDKLACMHARGGWRECVRVTRGASVSVLHHRDAAIPLFHPCRPTRAASKKRREPAPSSPPLTDETNKLWRSNQEAALTTQALPATHVNTHAHTNTHTHTHTTNPVGRVLKRIPLVHTHPPMAPPNATNCTALVAHASHPASVVLGVGFFFGMLISFIPQLVKIQRRRSSTGISPFWVFFSACMGTANVIGGVLLQQGLFTCCRPGARWQCVEVLLPLLTLCLNALMTGSVFTLCARHNMCVRRGGGGSGGGRGGETGDGKMARRHSLNYKTTVGAGEHEEDEGGGQRGGSGSGSGAESGAGAGAGDEEEEGGVGIGAVKPVRWRWVFALWSLFAATSWAVAMAGRYVHSIVQSIFSLYSVYVQSMFSLCSVYVQSMFSRCSV